MEPPFGSGARIGACNCVTNQLPIYHAPISRLLRCIQRSCRPDAPGNSRPSAPGTVACERACLRVPSIAPGDFKTSPGFANRAARPREEGRAAALLRARAAANSGGCQVGGTVSRVLATQRRKPQTASRTTTRGVVEGCTAMASSHGEGWVRVIGWLSDYVS